MKKLAALFTLAFCLNTTTYAQDLAEGHWISQKLDKAKKVLITYENWFETSSGEKVFRSKILKETPYAGSIPAKPSTTGSTTTAATGPFYCFANDFIAGHAAGDPKDDSCIGAHFKAKGGCLEDAVHNAIAQCQARSSNKETCEVNPRVNCFSEKNVPVKRRD